LGAPPGPRRRAARRPDARERARGRGAWAWTRWGTAGRRAPGGRLRPAGFTGPDAL